MKRLFVLREKINEASFLDHNTIAEVIPPTDLDRL